MGRFKNIEIAILNIKVHPHEPSKYVSLFYDLFKISIPVKIRGTDWGIPRYIKEIDEGKPENGLMGTFYKFLQINPNEPWLDLTSKENILNDDGEPIPQVDDDKKPNSREIEFVFYPKKHYLFFNYRAISHRSAQRFMINLCNDTSIRKKYGLVDVEIVSSQEVLEKILNIPSLTKLEISISRPNADVIRGRKQKFLEDMETQNIRQLKQEMTAEKHTGITPNEDTKALMDLATTNGKIYAQGYDGEEKVIESTEPHPQIERDNYDPDQTTFFRALINLSSAALTRLIPRG